LGLLSVLFPSSFPIRISYTFTCAQFSFPSHSPFIWSS
jgi:hypothetical protein